jgi:hypothetical protein
MRVEAVITCECGFEARAADEEGLVAEVRRHAAEAHCMPLSHEEALLLVFHAELTAQPTTAREAPDPPEEEAHTLPVRWAHRVSRRSSKGDRRHE